MEQDGGMETYVGFKRDNSLYSGLESKLLAALLGWHHGKKGHDPTGIININQHLLLLTCTSLYSLVCHFHNHVRSMVNVGIATCSLVYKLWI